MVLDASMNCPSINTLRVASRTQHNMQHAFLLHVVTRQRRSINSGCLPVSVMTKTRMSSRKRDTGYGRCNPTVSLQAQPACLRRSDDACLEGYLPCPGSGNRRIKLALSSVVLTPSVQLTPSVVVRPSASLPTSWSRRSCHRVSLCWLFQSVDATLHTSVDSSARQLLLRW